MATTSSIPANFGFGEEEELLRDTARKFLSEQLPIEKLRKLVAADHDATYNAGELPGWDEGLWKQIIELGWTGLTVPEAAGGIGFGLAGVTELIEEVGRHALPSPLVTTTVAALVLREAELETATAWLGRVADGNAMSLAITPEGGDFEPGPCSVRACPDGDGVILDGQAFFVQDAFKAETLLVTAQLDGEQVLCVVPVGAKGVRLEQNHIHDLTRDQATVHLAEVQVPEAEVVSREGLAALRRAWPALLTVIAADLCGSSEWQLQTTVEYAKTRKQFDHQLGFFQAVKHPLVNGMVEIDRARSLLYVAAAHIDAGSEEALRRARMAKSAASDAGAFLSDRSVQLHGGIGFTWECDVHLYFKRSMHNQALFGDGIHQRRELATELIGPIGS